MINLVPSSVNPIALVVNLFTSLVERIDKLVDLIPSSVDTTLMLESETQVIDLFPSVDHILPLENATQVVNLIPSLVDPTLPLESKPDTFHIFLIDTKSTMLGGIPTLVEPPPSNEAILFDWGALTGPRLPSHIPFNITIQVFGRDVPQTMIYEGASISIFSSIAWKSLGYSQLMSVT
jgi:hypothetical protein